MNWVRELKALVKSLISDRMQIVHTHIPCTVVSYDPNLNTCSIQPCIRIFRPDDVDSGTFDLPQLDDIPVVFPGSGGLFFSVPITEGSFGEYHVAEDDINDWLNAGGTVDPSSVDRFNLDTGTFHPAEPWMFQQFSAIATDRISIRTIDGNTEISVLKDGTIEIKGGTVTINEGTDVAVKANALNTWLTTTLSVSTAFGPSGPSLQPLTDTEKNTTVKL